jgi:hypothetical protein
MGRGRSGESSERTARLWGSARIQWRGVADSLSPCARGIIADERMLPPAGRGVVFLVATFVMAGGRMIGS